MVERNEAEGYLVHEQIYRKMREEGVSFWHEHQGQEVDTWFLDCFFCSPHLPSGRRVLEIGCGSGAFSLHLARLGYLVTGIDASASAIALARSNAAQAGLPVIFRQADACREPVLSPCGFDIVLDSHALHCITAPRDREAFLRYARESLAPDGVFVVNSMCRPVDDRIVVLLDDRGVVDRNPPRIFVEPEVLLQDMVSAGFRIDFHTVGMNAGDWNHTITVYARIDGTQEW